MHNGWTGGQYSLYRAIAGVYLLIHFFIVIKPAAMPLLIIAAIASVLFAIGLFDRIAAVVMCGMLVWISSPALPPVACLLLLHACLPAAPYGSWPARKRTDPRGGWSMPPAIFAFAWIALSLFYSYRGWMTIAHPSLHSWMLLYAPLALFRPLRPWIWIAMFATHCADLSFGMAIVHLFTFDPAWIRGRDAEATETVFYDGTCGLCHRAVRFILAEDRKGTAFTFAPLFGERYASEIGDVPGLPDSVIVRTTDARVLVKSAAILRLGQRLGGVWRILASIAGLVPNAMRDVAYDFVARVRYRIFGREKNACPILPPDLRARFSG
jgi:predicted DCC family thiol-disulfide oxidoreductase YuxK